MSVSLRNLSVLNYTNGFTLWHYQASSLPVALSPGFFDDAHSMLKDGDLILISGGGRATIKVVDTQILHHVSLGDVE